MKIIALALFALVTLASSSLHAQVIPQTHVEWFVEPATEIEITTGGAGMAAIYVNEIDAPYIRIVRAEGDFINVPESPFTVRIYDSLWLALEPYAKLRVKGRDAWVVTLADQKAALVKRK
jgi:hypothetical protein